MAYGKALTERSTEELKNVLRRLHQGLLPTPLSPQSLHAAGLSYLSDKVDFLLGLDEAGLRAVLVAVLAERRSG